MCLFTHFAAGALAGGVTGNPWMGAVAGLASHAVLDAIPHYDHPDWRLELGGGLLSLLLLMFMPFASLAAVLGGLGGMLPDLENLFQKLGKMRRDQFIYPTHTGLIPHGKSLGPRTLVWQVAIFVACFGLLGLVSPSPATAADEIDQLPSNQAVMGLPEAQVLESGQDRTRVRVTQPLLKAPVDWETLAPHQIRWAGPVGSETDDGDPSELRPVPFSLALAVPTTRSLEVRLVEVSWWKEPTSPVDPSRLIRSGDPAVFRSVPLAAIDFMLGADGGVLQSAVVEIVHQASGKPLAQLQMASQLKASGEADSWREKTPAGVLNPELFQALAQGGRQLDRQNSVSEKAAEKGFFNHFDLTGNWIRLKVLETGVYRVTGQELANLGLDPVQVDPTKLRVFRGGSVNLELDPEFPEADQAGRVGLTEMGIQVLDGGDGEWNLDDEIRFYGVGGSAWLDRLDPEALPLDHYDHPGDNHGHYWLTWAGIAEPSPLPGQPLRVLQSGAPALGGQVVTTARLREHTEKQAVDAAGMFRDNWSWDSSIISTRSDYFQVANPVPDSLAMYVLEFRPNPYDWRDLSHQCVARAWINDNNAEAATTTFLLSLAQNDSTERIRIVGETGSLVDGQNKFTFQNAGDSSRPFLALDCFDVFYWGDLDLRGLDGQFSFAHWGTQVETPGQAFDFQIMAQRPAKTLVWDVANPLSPRALQGETSGTDPALLTLGVIRDLSADLHLVVLDELQLLDVVDAELAHPVALRDQSSDVDYIVIYPDPEDEDERAGFAQAAQDLAAFHSDQLEGVENPVARAVLVTDIYDNFSGGKKDLLAIRNYLKSVYADGHRLRYVCLLGKATRDFRNYKGHEEGQDLVDFIPAQLRTWFPKYPNVTYSYFPYSSDDGLTSFDSMDGSTTLDVPDLVSGRLPATTWEEARMMVDNVINFARETPEGPWRNRVLMTSDDCERPGHPHPIDSELDHVEQAELLSNFYLPRTLDITKLHGVEYEFPPGSINKPQMRADINAALNAGTTLYYYVGHGAEDNLADEQIFQSRDIANLTNGLKRPFFIAFSCDVGVYDNPVRRSMAEIFVSSANGGAIGSICASQVSTISSNEYLSERFFEALYPGGQTVDGISVGDALMLAKAQMASYQRHNSQRYNLLSDPGLGMPNPISGLTFASSSVDTLRAGARQVVVAGGTVADAMLGAGDSYDLRVEESAYDKLFVVYGLSDGQPQDHYFRKLGSTVFRGSGVMESDELRAPFKVPSQLRYGNDASVRLVIEGMDGDRAGEMALPAVRSATGPVDDVSGPGINLSLPNRYRARPGDPLSAAFHDTSGIAILGTSPGNSILLEFDNTGFMTEITDYFNYDPNSYTSGRVMLVLPGDIAEGQHTAAIHASDALGNVGSDTLSFNVAEYGVTAIKDVTLFPNPTAGDCRLVFDLTDAMDVRWEIYTVAGRRVKTIKKRFTTGGTKFLLWEGPWDDQGDEIANGTYLFVLRGTQITPSTDGSDGPWVQDNRELHETGKLVIMR